MNTSITLRLAQLAIYLLVLLSGFATLSWEVIWQIKSTLALGASAIGTAITLTVILGGMSLGSFLISKFTRHISLTQALRLYGLIEFAIGIAGLFLNDTFKTLEKMDTWAYTNLLGSASLIHVLGMVAILAIPSLCMGATFSLLSFISQRFNLTNSKLYSINIMGAATGVLFTALVLIPLAGIIHTSWLIVSINLFIASCFWLMLDNRAIVIKPREENVMQRTTLTEIVIVSVTGFTTFALEIAWFRSFESIFQNTTDVFAIMLASVLIALALAAKNVSTLKQKKKSLSTQITFAGVLILLATPLIERLDLFFMYPTHFSENHTNHIIFTRDFSWLIDPNTFIVNWLGIMQYTLQALIIFFLTCLIIFPPMYLLGVALPWLLDEHSSSQRLGKLYAVNTFASIAGAVVTAWVLLPTFGFAKTAWLVGMLVIITGVFLSSGLKQYLLGSIGALALLIAIAFETGIGKTRAQGVFANFESLPAKIVDFIEGPQATISVVQYEDGGRALLINSSSASGEAGNKARPSLHYLVWMGHLPMLLHPNPKRALVIGFGTGQTTNALRKENPESIDIVDINPQVFKFAHHFKSNDAVLNDPRVTTIVMDGRAYLRRSKKRYDVITLEPMPPITTGMNALYSKEFYTLARKKLALDGVIAQWLPFHLLAPHYAASIAKTFTTVFPNAVLWIDPVSKDGILLGTKNTQSSLVMPWPGFKRTVIARNLSLNEIQKNLVLNTKTLVNYCKHGEVISDDNQLLAFGKVLYANVGLKETNFKLLHRSKEVPSRRSLHA